MITYIQDKRINKKTGSDFMNVTTITGNLTKDWELKKSKDGKTTIATNVVADNDHQAERTNFFNIKVIGKIAESYAKYTGKGSKVTVIGKMSLTNYTDKNGEQKQWFEVLVQQLDSHAPKKANNENNETEINEVEDGNDFPF